MKKYTAPTQTPDRYADLPEFKTMFCIGSCLYVGTIGQIIFMKNYCKYMWE